MKIICETKRTIETVTDCRKEYCCNKIKKAMTDFSDNDYISYYAAFDITKDNKIRVETHHGHDVFYDDETKYAIITYCPFCGTTLTVENIKIDKTGLPPAKKKHWWNF